MRAFLLDLLSVVWCFHDSRYQERRDGIMHYVCDRCGDATTMPRTEEEHRAMIQVGRVVTSKARKAKAKPAREGNVMPWRSR